MPKKIIIPKVIHYCWFGNKKMSKLQLDCIESWKKYLPDYELKLWNEYNVDLEVPFVKFAYDNQKWAYVSDFVRLDVLYRFGGIYLDTDMFLFKSLDDLLYNNCFFGAEDENLVNGAIIGCHKNHNFIKECLRLYTDETPKTWQLKLAIPRIITRSLEKFGSESNMKFNETRMVHDVKIFNHKYFYPLPYKIDRPFVKNFEKFKTQESYAIHLWDGSWVEYSEFQLIRKRMYFSGLKKIIDNSTKTNIFNLSYLKKVLSSLKDSLNLNNNIWSAL
jgi:mannosyltransferase OCH1-like enzyme